VELDRLSELAQRRLDLLRSRGRIEPVRAEGNQQRPRFDVVERTRERAVAVLACEVEVRQRA